MEALTFPRFYDFDGSPAYWVKGGMPTILSGKEWLPANLTRLSLEAEVIDQSEFKRLLNGTPMPPLEPKTNGDGSVTSQNGSSAGTTPTSGSKENPEFHTTMPEDPTQADEKGEHDVMVSGRNGIKYPAKYHAASRRIRLVDHKGSTLKKSSGTWCEGWAVRDGLVQAVRNLCEFGDAGDLRKSVEGMWFRDALFKRHFSKEELHSMQLKWITVHPNGADPGVPILVHDDGQNYTVVGGAGGKMNQLVFRKDDSQKGQKTAQRQQKVKQKAEAIANVKKDDPESFQKLEAAEQAYRDAAKAATSEYRQKAMNILGAEIENVKEMVAKEAEKRAKKELGLDKKPESEHTDEEKSDVQEFVAEAQKKVREEVNAAVEAIVNTALDATAKAMVNGEAVNADSVDAVKTMVNGKQLVKKLSDEDIQALVEGSARADQMRIKANAIRRALRSGNAEAVQGIRAQLYDSDPSKEQQDEWVKNRYLNRESVVTHTNLVKGSNLASERTQRAAQANGATDGLNHYVSDIAGEAILSPEVGRKIGVEGVARVAAAYLRKKGVDAKDLAGKLGDRIAEGSEADAAAALQTAAQLDEIAKSAVDASRSGDGTVLPASARIISGNMAAQKYRLLNTTRGRLRGAAALAHALEHPSEEPLVIPGGGTKITAHAKARECGLGKGTYVVKQQHGGGYAIEVPADKLHEIANPMSLASAERNAAMDELKQENDANWQQWDSPYLARPLFKHGVLAVKAAVQQKRVLLSYGAGSGKTGVAYGVISELLGKNLADRVLVSMPAKPRSQQENYVDEEGKEQTGEKFKFLKPEIHDAVTVIANGPDFDKKKAKIKSGEIKAIIMSPELMRKRQDDLVELGFGGKRSAYIADEAHRLSAGEGEGEGSGMARTADRLSQSEYYLPMSGTFIENNASELYDSLRRVDPEAYPKSGMKAFRAEWERNAASITEDSSGKTKLGGIFSNEAMSRTRQRLEGTMLSYHAPAKKKSGEDVGFKRDVHHVPLGEEQKNKIRKLNETRTKELASEDPKVRKAAPLRWQAGVIRAAINDEMFGKMAEKIKEGRKSDPSYRAVVWASELAPLLGKEIGDKERGVKQKRAGGLLAHMSDLGPTTQVTGSNSDKETKQALDEFNDRTNKNSALLVSNAGNFGINAQGGNAVFMAGHPLVYSNLDQLEHRVNRSGQEKDVESHIFIGDHPITKQLFHNVMNNKGKSARMLEVLAHDDSPVGAALVMNEKALKEAAGA